MSTNDDLVDNESISEASVFGNLKARFYDDKIYSCIGQIIIAVNPYKPLPSLYNEEALQTYLKATPGSGSDSQSALNAPPHIWRIAKEAFVNLSLHQMRQAIVISGESGAGKTETTKRVLQFISTLTSEPIRSGDLDANASISNDSQLAGINAPIEERVQYTSPLLESFGNAKTSRNDNSSRFGKWLEIMFEVPNPLDTSTFAANSLLNTSMSSDPKTVRKQRRLSRRRTSAAKLDIMTGSISFSSQPLRLVGASITQYLLEKSRVVQQAQGERNYHIFYQLVSDSSSSLGAAQNFRYLSQSGCTTVARVDDATEFLRTLAAFDHLNFPSDHRASILSALKGILYLGNVDFVANSDGNYSVVSNTLSDNSPVASAAKYFSVNSEKLSLCLTRRQIIVRGEDMEILLDVTQAVDTRNALAKEVYGRLFAHIVQFANKTLMPNNAYELPSVQTGEYEHDLVFGLLDIFGFEVLAVNSFEQLCINYANEKLQQYFIEFVMRKELELYDAEMVEAPVIAISNDNQLVLIMIDAKATGIFARLDEEVKMPKGGDASFLTRLDQDFNGKGPAATCYRRDVKMAASQFEIRHFAGQVRYDCSGFVEKNRDKLYQHLDEMLLSSTDNHFCGIMREQSPEAAAAQVLVNAQLGVKMSKMARRKSVTSTAMAAMQDKSQSTLSSRFQSQLNKLVHILNSSEAHFIRCIKPNDSKVGGVLEDELVLKQLRYLGVLQAIQLRKLGYPIRRKIVDFKKNYWMLANYSRKQLEAIGLGHQYDSKKCIMIVSELTKKFLACAGNIAVGRSLVFMRQEALKTLDSAKNELVGSAVLILQRRMRAVLARQRCRRLTSARTLLRILLSEGSANNRSNVECLPHLQDHFSACAESKLDLQSVEMKQAARLIERLTQVQEVKSRMAELLSSEEMGNFDDLHGHNRKVQNLLLEAEGEGIVLPEIKVLQAQVNSIQEQVDAVSQLDNATASLDDSNIARALDNMQRVAKAYELSFSGAVVSKGQEVLADLMTEIATVDEGINTILSLSLKYNQQVGLLVAMNQEREMLEFADPNCAHALSSHDEIMDSLNRGFDQALSLYVLSSTRECMMALERIFNGSGIVATGIAAAGGGRRRSFASGAVDYNTKCSWIPAAYDTFRFVHQLLFDLIAEDWKKLLGSRGKAEALFVQLRELGQGIMPKKEFIFSLPSNFRSTETMILKLDELIAAISGLYHLFQEEMERKSVVPIISAAICQGQFKGQPILLVNTLNSPQKSEDVMQNIIDAHSFDTRVIGIDESVQFLEGLNRLKELQASNSISAETSESTRFLISRAMRLMHARKYLVACRWDAALALTEDSADSFERRQRLLTSDLVSVVNLVDEAQVEKELIETYPEFENISVLTASSFIVGMGGIMHDLGMNIEEEFGLVREYAFNCYLQQLCDNTMEHLSFVDTPGEDRDTKCDEESKLDDDWIIVPTWKATNVSTSVKIMGALLREIDVLLSSAYQDEANLISQQLISCCSSLQLAVKLIEFDQWQELIDKFVDESGQLNAIAASVDLISSYYVAPLTRRCFKKIFSDCVGLVDRCKLEVTNRLLYGSLIRGDGSIKGNIGSLDVSVSTVDGIVCALEAVASLDQRFLNCAGLARFADLVGKKIEDVDTIVGGTGTNGLFKVCLNIAELRNAFIETNEDDLRYGDNGGNKILDGHLATSIIENMVVAIRRLHMYRSEHLGLLRKTQESVAKCTFTPTKAILLDCIAGEFDRQVFDSESLNAAGHLSPIQDDSLTVESNEQHVNDEVDVLSDSSSDVLVPPVPATGPSPVPGVISRELTLLEFEMMYVTSVKLIHKGFGDCDITSSNCYYRINDPLEPSLESFASPSEVPQKEASLSRYRTISGRINVQDIESEQPTEPEEDLHPIEAWEKKYIREADEEVKISNFGSESIQNIEPEQESMMLDVIKEVAKDMQNSFITSIQTPSNGIESGVLENNFGSKLFENLRAGISIANLLKMLVDQSQGSFEVPKLLDTLVEVANAILDVRTAIFSSQLDLATIAYERVNELEAVEWIPSVSREVHGVYAYLENERMVASLCLHMNRVDEFKGTPGLLVMPENCISSLESTVNDCRSSRCYSVHAFNLLRSAEGLLRVRQSLHCGDRGLLAEALATWSEADYLSLLGDEMMPKGLEVELARAKLELQSWEAISLLSTALVDEEVLASNGTIDFKQTIAISALSTAYLGNILTEEQSQSVLQELHKLAGAALRERIQLAAWNTSWKLDYLEKSSFKLMLVPNNGEQNPYCVHDEKNKMLLEDLIKTGIEVDKAIGSLEDCMVNLFTALPTLPKEFVDVEAEEFPLEIVQLKLHHMPFIAIWKQLRRVLATLTRERALIDRHLLVVKRFEAVRSEILKHDIVVEDNSSKGHISHGPNMQNIGHDISSNRTTIVDVDDIAKSPFVWTTVNIQGLSTALNGWATDIACPTCQFEYPTLFSEPIELAHNLLSLRQRAQKGNWREVSELLNNMPWPSHRFDSKHQTAENTMHKQWPDFGFKSSPLVSTESYLFVECNCCLCSKEIRAYKIEVDNRAMIDQLLACLSNHRVVVPSGGSSDLVDFTGISAVELGKAIDKASQLLVPRWGSTDQLLSSARHIHSLRLMMSTRDENGQVAWDSILSGTHTLLSNSHSGALLPGSSSPLTLRDHAALTQLATIASVFPPGGLHYSCHDELCSMNILAREAVTFRILLQAVRSGQVVKSSGAVGIDPSTIDVSGLENACEMVVESSMHSDRCEKLMGFAKALIILRKSILRIASSTASSDIIRDALQTIHYTVKGLTDLMSSPNTPTRRQTSLDTRDSRSDSVLVDATTEPCGTAGWSACKDEFFLITEFAHVKSLVVVIEESSKESTQVYKRRCMVHIPELLNAMPAEKDIVGSVSSDRQLAKDGLHLPQDSLLQALEVANSLSFVSDKLYRYFCCAQVLLRLRSAVNACDWKNDLMLVGSDSDTSSTNETDEGFVSWLFSKSVATALSPLPCALAELSLAQQECRNVVVHYLLTFSHQQDREHAIAAVNSLSEYGMEFDDPNPDICTIRYSTSVIRNLVAISGRTLVFDSIGSSSQLQNINSPHDLSALTLQKAISVIDAVFKVTSNSVAFLLDCMRKLDTLRQNFHVLQINQWDNDSAGAISPNLGKEQQVVIELLAWYQANGVRCILPIRQEFQRAVTIYKNRNLCSALLAAFQRGGIYRDNANCLHINRSNFRSLVNVFHLETSTLRQLIADGKEISHQSRRLKELLRIGQCLLSVRLAVRRLYSTKHNGMHFASNDASPLKPGSSTKLSKSDKELGDNPITFGRSHDPSHILGLKEAVSALKQCANITITIRNELDMAICILENEAALVALEQGLLPFGIKQESEIAPHRILQLYSVEKIIPQIEVDISTLEEAIEQCRSTVLLSDEIELLYRSAVFIRSLRWAVRMKEAETVGSMLTRCPDSADSKLASGSSIRQSISGPAMQLHPCTKLEIHVLKLSFQLHDYVVQLQSAMSDGWATPIDDYRLNCSTIETSKLVIGIDRISECIRDLQRADTNDQRMVDEWESDHPLGLLTKAAMKLLEIRQVLKNKDFRAVYNLITGSEFSFPSLYPQEDPNDSIPKDSSKLLPVLQHNWVEPEVSLYLRTIQRLLSKYECTNALKFISSGYGDLGTIEHALDQCQAFGLAQENNLMSSWLIQKATIQLTKHRNLNKVLKSALGSYSIHEVQDALALAASLHIPTTNSLVQEAQRRLASIRNFESTVSVLELSNSGGLDGNTKKNKAILAAASATDLMEHPLARRAAAFTALHNDQLIVATIAEAFAIGQASHAAKASMERKKSFLKSDFARLNFQLENFPNLRPLSESELLEYKDDDILDSLTIMNSKLAVVARWIFSHCVQGIAKLAFPNVEFLLRNLVLAGLNILPIRDEIFCQLIQQIRGNPNEKSVERLWRTLGACLRYFPPSRAFENYLELFLLQTVSAQSTRLSVWAEAAEQCIQFLHESVILFGYATTPTTWQAAHLRQNSSPMHRSLSNVVKAAYQTGTVSIHDVAVWFSPLITAGLQNPAHLHSTRDDEKQISVLPLSSKSQFGSNLNQHVAIFTSEDLEADKIRCTKSNWERRCWQLSGIDAPHSVLSAPGSEKDNSLMLGVDSMIKSLCCSDSDSYHDIENFDRVAWEYLLFGTFPASTTKFARELAADSNLFRYVEPGSRRGDANIQNQMSSKRREWLRQNLISRLQHPTVATSEDERSRAVILFWDTFVDRLRSLPDDVAENCREAFELATSQRAVLHSIRFSDCPGAVQETFFNWEIFREITLTIAEYFVKSNQAFSR